MMPQVINHFRMVFLSHTLTQLLKVEKSMSMEQMQKHLRSLHSYHRPNEAAELVSMQEDGLLKPVTIDELIKPIRTMFPGVMTAQTPTITEFLNTA